MTLSVRTSRSLTETFNLDLKVQLQNSTLVVGSHYYLIQPPHDLHDVICSYSSPNLTTTNVHHSDIGSYSRFLADLKLKKMAKVPGPSKTSKH